MADSELLTKHSALIPQIMQAMQSMANNKNNNTNHWDQPQRRVLVSEVEELALDKAAIECGKMMADVFKFEEMIQNTNDSHSESLKKIGSFFKEIIAALQEREKQLMVKLEEVRTSKTSLFQQQVDALKAFNKKYMTPTVNGLTY